MSAEEKLNEFFVAWQKKDLKALARTCQLTWIKTYKLGVVTKIETAFLSKDLLQWRIQKAGRVGKACVDVTANITYREKGQKHKAKIRPRLICETDIYKPDINGSWGVNSLSVRF